MKKLVIVAIVAGLALSGCASGKFLGFLATTDYVDKKTKDLEAATKALKSRLESMFRDTRAFERGVRAGIRTGAKTFRRLGRR